MRHSYWTGRTHKAVSDGENRIGLNERRYAAAYRDNQVINGGDEGVSDGMVWGGEMFMPLRNSSAGMLNG